MSHKIASIKGIIKELSLRSARMRAHANRLKGDERHQAQLKKLGLGRLIREHLLAYAFLRGRTYRSVEPIGELGSSWERESLSKRISHIAQFYAPRAVAGDKSSVNNNGEYVRKIEASEVNEWLQEQAKARPVASPEEKARVLELKRLKGEAARLAAGRAA